MIFFWKNWGQYVKRKHSSKIKAGLQQNKKFFLARKLHILYKFPYIKQQNRVELRAKVNQSLYRPRQALRILGGWGSQISWKLAQEGGKVVSLTHWLHLPPISVRGWVDPRAIVWPEGLYQWKIPVMSPGIKPTTFWFVVQCLNQLHHHMTPEQNRQR